MNPFSSRFVRPDQNVYRFHVDRVSDQSLRRQFVDRLLWQLEVHRRSAIIGPHGTGKTTLLRTVEPVLREAGAEIEWVTLSSDRRHSSREIVSRFDERNQSARSPYCLIVDGFEQLSGWQRLLILRAIRRRPAARLLVTCHDRPRLIPTCHVTQWNESITRHLTQEKLDVIPEPWQRRLWDRFEVRLSGLPTASRNLRDLWFAMYDEFEGLRLREGLRS